MENFSRGTCPATCNCCDADNLHSNDICYVEGSKIDRSRSPAMQSITETIWQNVKPPIFSLERPVPCVTARKVDIVRAQLFDRARYKSPLQTSMMK